MPEDTNLPESLDAESNGERDAEPVEETRPSRPAARPGRIELSRRRQGHISSPYAWEKRVIKKPSPGSKLLSTTETALEGLGEETDILGRVADADRPEVSDLFATREVGEAQLPHGATLPTAICPFLGLLRDRPSHFMIPSESHRCYSPKKPGRISLDYQQEYCLDAKYPTCHRYAKGAEPPPTVVPTPPSSDQSATIDQVVSAPEPSVSPVAEPIDAAVEAITERPTLEFAEPTAASVVESSLFQEAHDIIPVEGRDLVIPAVPVYTEAPVRARRRRFGGRLLDAALWLLAIVLAIFVLYTALPIFFPNGVPFLSSPFGSPNATATAVVVAPSSIPTAQPSSTPLPTETATRLIPTQSAFAVPTPPENGVILTLLPDSKVTGWASSSELQPHFGDRNLHAGTFKNETYTAVLQFYLNNLPPTSQVLFANLEMTGRDASHLGKSGQWQVELLQTREREDLAQASVSDINGAPALTVIGSPVAASELSAENANRFEFNEAQRKILQEQFKVGRITLRIKGPQTSEDNLFTWDAGSTPLNSPTLQLVVVPGQYTIVANTPTPENVLTAAAHVVRQTALARQFGTPTPYPPGVVTATPGGELFIAKVSPAPGNRATAIANAQLATAIAITTGTFTPTPKNVQFIFPTSTPVVIGTDFLNVRTPEGAINFQSIQIPATLKGKIIALSSRFVGSSAKAPVLFDPSGRVLGTLSSDVYYKAAMAWETYSPERQRRVVYIEDNAGVQQIGILDLVTNTTTQLTKFARVRGLDRTVAYDAVWSPDGSQIAFVSNVTGNDEIYVYDLGQNTTVRLTESSWTWNKHPSWSPDSSQITFWSNRTGNLQVYVMDRSGGNVVNISNTLIDEVDPVWVK